MKKNTYLRPTERDMFVFKLWDTYNLTFKEIAECDIIGCLSRKTISNYVYCKIQNTERQKLIVQMAKDLASSFSSTAKVIDHIFNNQPQHKLSEITIRRIIANCLKYKYELNNI